MRFPRKTTILLSLLAVFAGSLLHAQYEFKSSWIMAEEGRAQQIFFGAKTLVGIDIEISNLGSMPYIQGDEANYTYEFNDGYIDIPVPDGDFTSAFQFDYANSTADADGNVESFSLTRYRSESLGESYEGSFDFSTGWELGSRYDMWKLSNRVTMGFTVAGGFTPLRKRYEATVYGKLYRQTVTVPLSGPPLTHQETGTYWGSRYGGPFVRLDDIDFDTEFEELVKQILPGGDTIEVPSEVLGVYEAVGGMGTFRTGTYLDIYLTERLLMHLGVGVSASYLSFDFKVDQTLVSSTLANKYRRSASTDTGEWLLGAYAELNLVYRLNQRTSVYAGAQTHLMQKFKSRQLDQSTIDINLGTPTQFQTGFEFDF